LPVLPSLELLLLALVVVGAFVLMGWALAWVLWRTGAMDPVTAVLATSPGGMVQMGALTSEMEANAPLVVGFHLLRIVTVLFTVPIVSRFAGKVFRLGMLMYGKEPSWAEVRKWVREA
jgi:uncharacterized membrane protein AbrB (regulator of aidB expression)